MFWRYYLVGGGQGVQTSRLPYLAIPAPAPFSWLPPFCPFSIAKYYAMLHNFPLFLPLPALLELPPPVPLPPPILLGSHPPVPPPQLSYWSLILTTLLLLKLIEVYSGPGADSNLIDISGIQCHYQREHVFADHKFWLKLLGLVNAYWYLSFGLLGLRFYSAFLSCTQKQ